MMQDAQGLASKTDTENTVEVSHIADFYQRYPGDDVTLSTRITVRRSVPALTLRISFPEGLVPGNTYAPDNVIPQAGVTAEMTYLVWKVDAPLDAGVYEYHAIARVSPTLQDVVLPSRATVVVPGADGESVSVSDAVSIAVSAKGRYLQYLPSIYQSDDLMGRFLMLFESFWSPIDRQIAQIPVYFDPKLTPPELLSWLASWLGLVLNENWSLERRRLLIQSAATLYRRRGTKWALERYLEIFTGVKPVIVEHMAHNFRLGAEGKLGLSIALGRENMPHTFTVILSLSPVVGAESEAENARLAQEHRRLIETIIETEKPAHAAYTLRIEPKQGLG
ncbi:MAG: hypothetical protein JW934_24820 [Anaerolineae bacterium]|nr:hypothetical protein [Anaerolineae bacterium]